LRVGLGGVRRVIPPTQWLPTGERPNIILLDLDKVLDA
jgi:hypothetical protein